jgi:hypothetical protein
MKQHDRAYEGLTYCELARVGVRSDQRSEGGGVLGAAETI